MESNSINASSPEIETWDEQKRRLDSERRLKLYIYLPIAIVAILALLIFIGLVTFIFSDGVGNGLFASGLADSILILAFIPLLGIGLVLNILFIGALVYKYQNKVSLVKIVRNGLRKGDFALANLLPKLAGYANQVETKILDVDARVGNIKSKANRYLPH